MPLDITATLKQKRIRAIQINIDPEQLGNHSFSMNAEANSQLRLPKENDDLSFLLVCDFNVVSQNDPNLFYAHLTVDFYFELNTKISDYNQVIEEQCVPIIKNELQDVTNHFLQEMGYPPFLMDSSESDI